MNETDTPLPEPRKPSPRKKISRDSDGCIEGLEYKYTPDGLIDWRAMIPAEFLVVNKQAFEKYGKSVPESTEGLKDNQLLILLGGIKYLAAIRGFESVSHTVTCPSPDYVVSTCSISWLPNFETEGREIYFSAIGDASLKNTSNFGSNYLGPIAENRAFVRAVRNFLKINVCGQDEISPNIPNSEENSVESLPSDILNKTLKDLNISFDTLRIKLIEENIEGAAGFKSASDIPKHLIFSLIGRLKKRAEEKTK